MQLISKLLNLLKITHLIKLILKKFGVEIIHSKAMTFDKSLKKLIEIYNIETILDIGSNIGQFSSKILNLNYKKKLILIEPTKKTFQKLNQEIKKNKFFNKDNVEFYNIALGTKNSHQTMYKSSRGGDMNSLLKINNDGTNLVKNSNIIDEETVEVQDINDFLENKNLKNFMIKIDIEGLDFELVKHIKIDYLKNITAIMLEVPELKFFNDQKGDFKQVIDFFNKNGFFLYNIDPFFVNPATGQVLIMDHIYVNKNIYPKNIDKNFNYKIGYPKIYF